MTEEKNSRDHGISHYHHMDANADKAEQLRSIYADWATKYDHDNDHTLQTVSQPNAVALLSQHLTDKNAEILDVGCGTGLVGINLSHAGFKTFDGTDLSPEMLELARPRGYRRLFIANADEGLPVADNTYDAAICVGVFTHGHVGPEGIDELLRITRPGGVVVLTVNEGVWKSDGFDTAVQGLSDEGNWHVLDSLKQDYMVNESVQAWYIAARKL